ncbi:foldase protein PrsA [Kolteria novifilia]|uniref:peptidylprolyl isomerase n=1 Tax=Kolteria novifilia TaxID=2527975 RepID=UPI003AF362E8
MHRHLLTQSFRTTSRRGRRLIEACALLAALLVLPTDAAAGDLAVVNGKVVTSKDVDQAFQRTRFANEKRTEEQVKLFRRRLLQLIIDDTLVNQYLDQRDIQVDSKDVDKHVATFRKRIEAQGGTLEEFLEEMNIDEDKMRQDITNIHRWLKYVRSQANDSVLRTYFEANADAFNGTLIGVQHILVKVDADADPQEWDKARQRISSIRAQLASGVTFDELARVHSDCPSREKGGDLGKIRRKGDMAEPFAAAAFDLKVGQISGLVKTDFGYHLIKVTDREPGKSVSFETVVESVTSQYAEDLRDTVIARMRSNSEVKMLR